MSRKMKSCGKRRASFFGLVAQMGGEAVAQERVARDGKGWHGIISMRTFRREKASAAETPTRCAFLGKS